MARGVNKAIILGNMGADPELRATANGTSVCSLRIATSEQWKDKQTGERKEQTEWHAVICFGKLADIAGQYLQKGRQVYIEGRIQTRKWQDKDGADRYTTEIVASELQMLGGGDSPKPASTGASDYAAASGGRRPAPAPAPAPDFGDDIPFN